MSFQLCTKNPLKALLNKSELNKLFPQCGLRIVSETAAEIPPAWINDLVYIPSTNPPENYDKNTHRLVRSLTETEYGWDLIPLTQEQIDDRNQTASPPGPTPLTLIDRIIALGKWDEFDTLIQSFPSYVEKAFYAASDIKRTHPLFAQYGSHFKSALGLDDQGFDDFLTP